MKYNDYVTRIGNSIFFDKYFNPTEAYEIKLSILENKCGRSCLYKKYPIEIQYYRITYVLLSLKGNICASHLDI